MRRKTATLVLAGLMTLALFFVPAARAAHFQFGADSGKWGKGSVNREGIFLSTWSPISLTSSNGDSLVGAYASFSRFSIFDAIGKQKIKYGHIYQTINDQPFIYANDFVVTPKPRHYWKVTDTERKDMVLQGMLHLSSIGFGATGHTMVLTGYLSDLFIDNTIKSSVLDEFTKGGRASFSLVVSHPYKDIVANINKRKYTSGMRLNPGNVSVTSAAAPEPASLLLFGGGLAGLVAWRRRRVSPKDIKQD